MTILWVASSVTVQNGSNLVTVNTAEDISKIEASSLLHVVGSDIPYEIERTYNNGTNDIIVLYENWDGGNATAAAAAAPSGAAVSRAAQNLEALRLVYEQLADETSSVVTANSLVKRTSAGRVKTANAAAADDAVALGQLGTSATRDVVTSDTDTASVDRAITVKWMGLGKQLTTTTEDDENIQMLWEKNVVANGQMCTRGKRFPLANPSTTYLLYLGTFKEGYHTITSANRGNSAYNGLKIDLTLDFDSTGTDEVDPHSGLTILNISKSAGYTEYGGLHSIKLGGALAAIYMEYNTPISGAGSSVMFSVTSCNLDPINAYSPFQDETWTPLNSTSIIGDAFRIPEVLSVEDKTNGLLFKGNDVFHEGNSINALLYGVGTTSTTSPTIDNLDTLFHTTTGKVSANAVGRPDGLPASNCSVFCFSGGAGGRATQILSFESDSYSPLYLRTYNGSTWTSWRDIYHSGNTNFDEFGGLAIDDIVAVGVVPSATFVEFYLPINATTQPTGVDVVSTFKITNRSDGTTIATGVTPVFNSLSSNKVLRLTIGSLTGLNTGDNVILQCETASSKITVNF